MSYSVKPRSGFLISCFSICFTGKYKDNEAIEFSFDLNKDVPEDVAQEMVSEAPLSVVWEEKTAEARGCPCRSWTLKSLS